MQPMKTGVPVKRPENRLLSSFFDKRIWLINKNYAKN